MSNILGANATNNKAKEAIKKNNTLLITLNGLQTLNNTVKHVNVAFNTIIVVTSLSVITKPGNFLIKNTAAVVNAIDSAPGKAFLMTLTKNLP